MQVLARARDRQFSELWVARGGVGVFCTFQPAVATCAPPPAPVTVAALAAAAGIKAASRLAAASAAAAPVKRRLSRFCLISIIVAPTSFVMRIPLLRRLIGLVRLQQGQRLSG